MFLKKKNNVSAADKRVGNEGEQNENNEATDDFKKQYKVKMPLKLIAKGVAKA